MRRMSCGFADPSVRKSPAETVFPFSTLGRALCPTGHARFEELLDAREAHRDVLADGRHAAGVERAHRELRARLADGLGGDDAHGLTGVHELAAREVASVAGAADAVLRVAAERGAHAN